MDSQYFSEKVFEGLRLGMSVPDAVKKALLSFTTGAFVFVILYQGQVWVFRNRERFLYITSNDTYGMFALNTQDTRLDNFTAHTPGIWSDIVLVPEGGFVLTSEGLEEVVPLEELTFRKPDPIVPTIPAIREETASSSPIATQSGANAYGLTPEDVKCLDDRLAGLTAADWESLAAYAQQCTFEEIQALLYGGAAGLISMVESARSK